MNDILTIGTDGGAAPKNPGPTGSAWVAEDGRWQAKHLGHGTNNIGELTAIKLAIEANPDRPLRVLSDSQYAINCVTTWGPNWRRKGVKDKKNQELIYEIIDLVAARRSSAPVTFEWVRAHDASNSAPLNSLADQYANAATDPGFGEQTGVIEDVAEASAAAAARQPGGRSAGAGKSGAGKTGAAKDGATGEKPQRKASGAWQTMTEIGKAHGLTAQQVGRRLTEAGLRDGSLASEAAVEAGWAKHRTMKNGTTFSVWNRHKVGELLGG
ncbi:ribonuclease HI [Gulosibacter sp. 10]|uniref:ribonuclease HI n=1 Tax=Gulosibacter sp. 10 TaxID=1255570 RepID=UPI00159570DB|nr:RNase H family protein [Gulosibacter sp. 10]